MGTQIVIRKLLVAIVAGVSLTVSTLFGLALAQGGDEIAGEQPTVSAAELEQIAAQIALSRSHYLTPLNFVRLITDEVQLVYDLPQPPLPQPPISEITPVRELKPGFVFLSLKSTTPISYDGELWYHINDGEYIKAKTTKPVTASTFAGIQLASHPELPFGWVVRQTPVAPKPGITPPDGATWLPRYTIVTIYETRYFGEWGWHRIGDDQWIQLYDVGMIKPKPRPKQIPAGERWIEVDLFEQSFAAYNENDEMIYATLVSSGLPADGWRTPAGLFHLKSARVTGKMAGGGMSDYYFLEDVQATIFFTESYAFHAAYWHDDFGRYKSHGCVNMSVADATWLFDWAAPENITVEDRQRLPKDAPRTWVWVHNGLLDQLEAEAEEEETAPPEAEEASVGVRP